MRSSCSPVFIVEFCGNNGFFVHERILSKKKAFLQSILYEAPDTLEDPPDNIDFLQIISGVY